ncbi:MAG: ABC transporter ATP-binding protein, partial [Flavobacteriales bacterium]
MDESIRIAGLGKRYGRHWALRAVDCAFHPGEAVMLIGPNASGKTTLVRCMLGLVRPTEGSIAIGGALVTSRAVPDPAYRASIGYMPQISQFPGALTVQQLLAMMADIRGIDPAGLDDELVDELGLRQQLNKRLGSLSGGTRQKVSAMLAFRSRPRVLVMDEPTAGLDPLTAARVLARAGRLRDEGGTVLVTSHLMEEVEALADRVAYLEDGRLRFLMPVKEMLESTGSQRLAAALPRLLAHGPQP